MNSSLAKSLMNLDNVFGVSGDETEVAKVLKEEMEGLYDEYLEDALGNQIFVKYGRDKNKKVLLTAHMDEIGFMVNYIEDNGFCRMVPVGYHDDRMAVDQDLAIITASGKIVDGITGSKPAHILTEEDHEKVIKIEDLFIDLGTESREETLALGVNLGDYVAFNRKGFFLNGGKYYTGKSIDDRCACAVMVEVMKRLQTLDIEPTVYAVGTVQEEVGMRAGGPVATRVKPDLMLALDVTLAGGTPGVELRQCAVMMGKGPAIKYYDWDGALGMTGNNVPRKLTNRLIAVAEKHGIPFQREVMTGGGTDAWSASMAHEGVLAGGISIPSQYIHTAVSTVHMDDLHNTVEFTVKYLEDYVTL
ncbi:MAG: M20/M25/M40 family metallo-hydrolase [Anaerovorax sp.]